MRLYLVLGDNSSSFSGLCHFVYIFYLTNLYIVTHRFTFAAIASRSHFSAQVTPGTIYYGEFQCTGSESFLISCPNGGLNVAGSNCGEDDVAAILCGQCKHFMRHVVTLINALWSSICYSVITLLIVDESQVLSSVLHVQTYRA